MARTEIVLKSVRLMKIPYLLAASPQGYTSAEIAKRCGVSQRTAQRDLLDLEEQGLPVVVVAGRYTLLGVWRPPMWLTPEEAVVLFTGVHLVDHFIRTSNLWVDGALEKLVSVLPSVAGNYQQRWIEAINSLTPRPLRKQVADDLRRTARGRHDR